MRGAVPLPRARPCLLISGVTSPMASPESKRPAAVGRAAVGHAEERPGRRRHGRRGPARVFDCGVNAVYLVRRLKGMDADLKEISGHLARDAKKGSSIHDLETYLHAAGLKTDARLMRLSDLCRNRGTLSVLLTRGKNGTGHFVVARVLPNVTV